MDLQLLHIISDPTNNDSKIFLYENSLRDVRLKKIWVFRRYQSDIQILSDITSIISAIFDTTIKIDLNKFRTRKLLGNDSGGALCWPSILLWTDSKQCMYGHRPYTNIVCHLPTVHHMNEWRSAWCTALACTTEAAISTFKTPRLRSLTL